MKLVAFAAILVLLALSAPPVQADQIWHDATLHCDPAANRALLLLDGTSQYDVPALPTDIDRALSTMPAADNKVCRLGNGQAIKAKVAHDQAFAYGACGADPMAFLSLWIGGRKVLSRFYFYGGCEGGLVTRAILLSGDRLTQCNIMVPATIDPAQPTTRDIACVDISARLAATLPDPVEYPAAGVRPLASGALLVANAVDTDFCAAFIVRAEQTEEQYRYHGSMMNWWRDGDVLDPFADVKGAGAARKVGPTRIGSTLTKFKDDFDNDGSLDEVARLYDDTHYFDGDYFIVEPRHAELKLELQQRLGADIDHEELEKWSKIKGIAVYSGASTPYATVRYTHFIPIKIDGRTLLWAWPTNQSLRPTALLYKPGPLGELTAICEFQRVEENF